MQDIGGVSAAQLKSYIERIERLEEEKAGIGADIRELYNDAKGNGFDTKALREVIRIRKSDKAKLAEQEAIVETYCIALGITMPGEHDIKAA